MVSFMLALLEELCRLKRHATEMDLKSFLEIMGWTYAPLWAGLLLLCIQWWTIYTDSDTSADCWWGE